MMTGLSNLLPAAASSPATRGSGPATPVIERVAATDSSGNAAPAGGNNDMALTSLRKKCVELEEEKSRILLEAETEIQQLSAEQRILREELESAGEMIERLGKELELS